MTLPPRRAKFADFKDRMAAIGFEPKRRFGQNFLLDPTLHHYIVAEAAGLTEHDLAFEIGGGLGFLTRELAAVAARVLCVEVDPRLVQILNEEVPTYRKTSGDPATVRLLHADAMAGAQIAPVVTQAVTEERRAVGGDVVLVANLPYAVAGPILGEIASGRPAVNRGAVLIQAEMAERLVAEPGSKAYGATSVVMQVAHRVAMDRRVGREVFRPRPNVDSAILTFGPSGAELPPGVRLPEFSAFVRRLFQQRRKRIRGVVRDAIAVATTASRRAESATEALPELPTGIDQWLGLRPDALSPSEHLELFVACGAGQPMDQSEIPPPEAT